MAAASFATGRRELTVVHRAMALSASCCGSSAVHGPCVGRMDIASGPRTSDSDKPPFFMSFFAFFFFFFFFFSPFFSLVFSRLKTAGVFLFILRNTFFSCDAARRKAF